MNGDLLSVLVQYGMSGIALYMMYSITYNHLNKIQIELNAIRTVLLRIEEKIG